MARMRVREKITWKSFRVRRKETTEKKREMGMMTQEEEFD